jgi:quinol monooxygenase YgiN
MALLPIAAAPAARAQGGQPIHMVRYVEVMPDAKGQVPAMLKQLAEASRKEAGVMRFEVLQRTAPSSQFVIIDTWKDQQALDAHLASAHAKQFMDQIKPLLISPIDSRDCTALDMSPAPEGRIRRGRRYVVTHVDVGPPNKDKAIEAMKVLAAASRKDNGNVRYDVLSQNVRNMNHFEVIEVWRTQRDDDAHEIAAHTKDFRTTLTPLSGALYDQRWYRPL